MPRGGRQTSSGVWGIPSVLHATFHAEGGAAAGYASSANLFSFFLAWGSGAWA